MRPMLLHGHAYLQGRQVDGVGKWDDDGCDADGKQDPVSPHCPEVVDAGGGRRCIDADGGLIFEFSRLFSDVVWNKFGGGFTAVLKLNGHPFEAERGGQRDEGLHQRGLQY